MIEMNNPTGQVFNVPKSEVARLEEKGWSLVVPGSDLIAPFPEQSLSKEYFDKLTVDGASEKDKIIAHLMSVLGYVTPKVRETAVLVMQATISDSIDSLYKVVEYASKLTVAKAKVLTAAILTADAGTGKDTPKEEGK